MALHWKRPPTRSAAICGTVCLSLAAFAIYADVQETETFKGGFLAGGILLIGSAIWDVLYRWVRPVQEK